MYIVYGRLEISRRRLAYRMLFGTQVAARDTSLLLHTHSLTVTSWALWHTTHRNPRLPFATPFPLIRLTFQNHPRPPALPKATNDSPPPPAQILVPSNMAIHLNNLNTSQRTSPCPSNIPSHRTVIFSNNNTSKAHTNPSQPSHTPTSQTLPPGGSTAPLRSWVCSLVTAQLLLVKTTYSGMYVHLKVSTQMLTDTFSSLELSSQQLHK